VERWHTTLTLKPDVSDMDNNIHVET
jgi:hypothetical protein